MRLGSMDTWSGLVESGWSGVSYGMMQLLNAGVRTKKCLLSGKARGGKTQTVKNDHTLGNGTGESFVGKCRYSKSLSRFDRSKRFSLLFSAQVLEHITTEQYLNLRNFYLIWTAPVRSGKSILIKVKMAREGLPRHTQNRPNPLTEGVSGRFTSQLLPIINKCIFHE